MRYHGRMMTQHLLYKGVLLGFSIAAPVGPIGVLCIRRTLAHGRLTGLLSGLGAATADAFYGGLAAFGLRMITGALTSLGIWPNLVGGLFLAYLGVSTFLATPADPVATRAVSTGDEADGARAGYRRAYFSALGLTLTNPMTIITFAGVYAGAGLTMRADSHWVAASLVVGVFLGSALWWLTLSTGVGLLRRWVNLNVLRWVNRVSGIILMAFAVWSLLKLFAG